MTHTRPGSGRPTRTTQDHEPRAGLPSAFRRDRRRPGVVVALAAALALGACADDPPPEASGDYPDIADSPSRRPAVTPVREREEIAEGLRADRREDRYALESGERRRSTEVQPPDYAPPAEAPAANPPAARLDAGEAPTGAPGGEDALARTPLAPLPGTERDAVARVPPSARSSAPSPATSPSGVAPPGGMPASMPQAPAPALAPVANPYASGPIVIDSRGVMTMAPGGAVTTQGPYPVGGPLGAAGPVYPGAATAAGVPGTQPLTAYASLAGVRTQRVAVIYFANGSAGLSGQDRQVLRQVAALQRQYGGLLRVIGHASSRTAATDITRHKMANFAISLQRANAVAEALMREGTPGQYLYVGSVSDSQPVYYEIMPTGEAGNRRAEIYLDY
ncbi:OmpA family protein [Roseospira visakhapatnamensis]|uniref:Flagellar motor protein MotB n=1 Tax=Roseospira visakhapatnamensis TaxID=390880 RepID=A0A7W6WAG6_9PROT|nr:flagellar motor protein MotB [Roseospira visakhapatnamensis]